jgi:hypothetical protein
MNIVVLYQAIAMIMETQTRLLTQDRVAILQVVMYQLILAKFQAV